MGDVLPEYLKAKYKKGDAVTVHDTDFTDHVRKVFDGMRGTTLEPEKRYEKAVIKAPLVRFERGDVYMGMHQLIKEG